MKVFDISKEELLNIRTKWLVSIFVVIFCGALIDLLIFFLHDRFKFALYLFIVIFISMLVVIYCFSVLFIKLRTIKQYLFILNKSSNSLRKGNYHFVGKDENIKVFNSLSFYILNFERDGQTYSFYFLYDKVPALKEGSLITISHVDDIALDYEVINHE